MADQQNISIAESIKDMTSINDRTKSELFCQSFGTVIDTCVLLFCHVVLAID